jgi:hypothetical protein
MGTHGTGGTMAAFRENPDIVNCVRFLLQNLRFIEFR